MSMRIHLIVGAVATPLLAAGLWMWGREGSSIALGGLVATCL